MIPTKEEIEITKKDYKFIDDFGVRHNIRRGDGFYVLMRLFLEEYKKDRK